MQYIRLLLYLTALFFSSLGAVGACRKFAPYAPQFTIQNFDILWDESPTGLALWVEDVDAGTAYRFTDRMWFKKNLSTDTKQRWQNVSDRAELKKLKKLYGEAQKLANRSIGHVR